MSLNTLQYQLYMNALNLSEEVIFIDNLGDDHSIKKEQHEKDKFSLIDRVVVGLPLTKSDIELGLPSCEPIRSIYMWQWALSEWTPPKFYLYQTS